MATRLAGAHSVTAHPHGSPRMRHVRSAAKASDAVERATPLVAAVAVGAAVPGVVEEHSPPGGDVGELGVDAVALADVGVLVEVQAELTLQAVPAQWYSPLADEPAFARADPHAPRPTNKPMVAASRKAANCRRDLAVAR